MSSKSKPLNVLVAGGGVAGPCFAYWLLRAGFSPKPTITIIERAPVPRTQGQSIDIRDTAVPVMRKMGLEAAVKARTTPETGTIFVDSKGKTIAKFDASGNADKQSMTSEFEILRADLASVFIDATRNLEGVKYVFGQRIAEISQDESGVDVTFTGDLPKERYDLVVAADGQMSKTRTAIFGPDDPSHFNFLGGYFAFFSIPYDAKLDEPPLWRWNNAAGGHSLMTRPHANPRTIGAYLGHVTSNKKRDEEFEEALTQGVEAQKKVYRKKFQDAGWQAERILDGMDSTDDFYMTPLTQVKIPKWSKGRCICVGDAAYGPTVFTGAGTSLAIEGAYMLAGELGNSGGDIPAAFEKYEQLFRPHVEKTQKIPSILPHIMNPNSSFALSLQQGAIRIAHYLAKVIGGIGDGSSNRKLPEYDWAPE